MHRKEIRAKKGINDKKTCKSLEFRVKYTNY